MANLAPLLQYLNTQALADRTTMENVPPLRPEPSPLARIYGQEGGVFIGGGLNGYTPPGPPYSPPLPLGRYPMPVPLPSYPPSNVMPPQPPPPAPPQRPGDFALQDGGTMSDPQMLPQIEVEATSGGGMAGQDGAQRMDPRYGIQPRTDQGFGSYQPSAADFGEKQQQQSPGMSDAGMWGLLAAGLGILANNYGNYGQAGPAIGKGGMMGLNTFLEQRQIAERNKFAQQELDQRAKRDASLDNYYNAQAAAMQQNADTKRDQLNQPKYIQLKTGGIAVMRNGTLEKVVERPEDMTELAISLAETETEKAYARNNPAKFIQFKGEAKERLERAKAGKPEFGFTYYDKKRSETAGAEVAKQLSAKQQSAMQAGDYADQISTIANALEDYEGGITDEVAGRVGQLFPNSPWGEIGTSRQFVDSIRTKLAPQLRVPGSGATTDFEYRMYLNAIPNLLTTKAGRTLMVQYAQRMSERESEAADLYAELAGMTEDGSVPMKLYRERIKAMGPLFSKEELDALKGKPGGGLPHIKDDADYDKLPSGAQFYDPKGNLRSKP
jgi:hypothetical protein